MYQQKEHFSDSNSLTKKQIAGIVLLIISVPNIPYGIYQYYFTNDNTRGVIRLVIAITMTLVSTLLYQKKI
jgi:hypothetical protein